MNGDVFMLIVMPSLYCSVHVVSKDKTVGTSMWIYRLIIPRDINICVGWIVTHVEHAYGSLDLLAITHPHSNSSRQNYQNT